MKLNKHIQVDDFNFEIKGLTARHVTNFGDPYDVLYKVVFTNGEVHVEEIIKSGEEVKFNAEPLHKLLRVMGYDKYTTCVYKDGERIKRVNEVPDDKSET